MKKILKPISFVLIALLICWLIYGLITFLVLHRKWSPYYSLGYLDQIECDMRPEKVIKILGDPREKKNLSSSGASQYSFDIELDGKEAELVMIFTDDKYLYSATLEADAASPEEANRLAEIWKDRIIAAYEKVEGFHSDAPRIISESGYEIKMEISNGPVGSTVKILVEGTTIRIFTDLAY